MATQAQAISTQLQAHTIEHELKEDHNMIQMRTLSYTQIKILTQLYERMGEIGYLYHDQFLGLVWKFRDLTDRG